MKCKQPVKIVPNPRAAKYPGLPAVQSVPCGTKKPGWVKCDGNIVVSISARSNGCHCGGSEADILIGYRCDTCGRSWMSFNELGLPNNERDLSSFFQKLVDDMD